MSDDLFNTILLVIVTIIFFIVLYPIIYVLSSSFSSGTAVSGGQVLLWPVDFSVVGYKLVFKNKMIWTGYLNSFIYVILGTLLHLVMRSSVFVRCSPFTVSVLQKLLFSETLRSSPSRQRRCIRI